MFVQIAEERINNKKWKKSLCSSKRLLNISKSVTMANCGGCKDDHKKKCQECIEAANKKKLMSEWIKEDEKKKKAQKTKG